MYKKSYLEVSIMGDPVGIISEALYKANDNEYYYYNICGYTPKNGLPFVALKANIIVVDKIDE